MPTFLYVYRCEEEHDSEEYRNVDNRDKPKACEQCGKDTKRVIFPTPFLFKGEFFDGPPGGDF